MVAIDWVLLAIVAVSAVFGLMRGLVGVLASLAAWLLAGWAAFQFGAQVALLLAGADEPGLGELLAGYALSFIGVLVVVGVVGWLLRKLLHSVGLSGLDRALGLAAGVVRGAFIGCVLVLLAGLTALPREDAWRQSQVVPVLRPGAEWLAGWLPDWVAAQIDLDGDAAGAAALLPVSMALPAFPAGHPGELPETARPPLPEPQPD